MRRLVLAAILAAAAATPALAKEEPDDQPHPVLPTPAQFAAVWPRDAAGAPVQGRVLMGCKVDAAGALSACRSALENPAGAGLAEAAVKLAPHYRFPGAPAGEMIVPVFFFSFDKPAAFARLPTAAELLSVYPTEAGRRGLDGRATISCMVSRQGGVYDCVPIYETPPGAGFGSAAVALSPQFLMKPAERNGRPVVTAANFPVRFKTHGPVPSGDSKSVVSPVSVWLEAPTVADVAAAYPAKARAQKIGGRATVACNFALSGRLVSCDTVSQEPKNLGFSDAAKQVAKKFLGKAPEGERLTSAMVQIPVSFDPAMLEAQTPVVGKPAWAGTPTVDDMKAVLANLPKNRGSVRVRLACIVEQQGRLSGCAVDAEQPAGEGFGQAALSLSPKFRMATWTNDGLPVVGGRVLIPLRFDTGEPPAAAAK